MRSRLWPLKIVSLVALLGAAGACAPPPDYLFVDTHVQPIRVELRKSFGVLHKHYEPVAITECSVYKAAGNGEPWSQANSQELWRVVGTSSGQPVLDLRYGEVPQGFVQATPVGGRPSPLEPGQGYAIQCSGDAIGVSEFTVPETITRPAPPLLKRTD